MLFKSLVFFVFLFNFFLILYFRKYDSSLEKKNNFFIRFYKKYPAETKFILGHILILSEVWLIFILPIQLRNFFTQSPYCVRSDFLFRCSEYSDEYNSSLKSLKSDFPRRMDGESIDDFLSRIKKFSK